MLQVLFGGYKNYPKDFPVFFADFPEFYIKTMLHPVGYGMIYNGYGWLPCSVFFSFWGT